MININQLLQEGIKQVQSAGISTGKINPEVKVNSRAIGRFGQCKRFANSNYDYQIEINEKLLSADKKDIMNVVIHEILHTCKNCMNHGTTWKTYVKTMNKKFGYNISRTTSYEKLNIEKPDYKYIVECENCGIQIGRQQKSKLITHTHLYRCKCNGKLKLN